MSWRPIGEVIGGSTVCDRCGRVIDTGYTTLPGEHRLRIATVDAPRRPNGQPGETFRADYCADCRETVIATLAALHVRTPEAAEAAARDDRERRRAAGDPFWYR